MRSSALLGFAAAAALATAAFAQETPPAPPPAPEPAPAPAPAPAPEPAAAPEAPAVEAPPAPPPAPTDVTSVAVLNVLDRVCNPMTRGKGDLKTLATPLGFKLKKGVWSWQYAKGYQISVTPPGTNPEVCTVDVDHPIDGVTPLIIDLHNWAMQRGWELYRNDKIVTDRERVTRSWELRDGVTGALTEAVVLMSERKADGTPLNKKADHTQLLYSYYGPK